MKKQPNPYLLTLPQLISAKAKISKVACFYDPQKISLEGFDSIALNPTEFREQLRRNMDIKLTDAELGAIVMLFDSDGDGKIGTIEFINEFLRLGVEKKIKMKYLKEVVERKIAREKEKIRKKRQQQFDRLKGVAIATTWTEEEENSAISKLANAAFSYDNMKGGLEGFYDVASLSIVEFREQLRRNFEIILSSGEASGLANRFNVNNTGDVDTSKFLEYFFRLKRSEIDRHFERQARATREIQKIERDRLKVVNERFMKLVESKLTPATEEDKRSVLKKFREAAAFYKKNTFVDEIQKAFESEDLTPTAFKNLVQRVFVIQMTSGELDAAVALFDDNGDGAISCVEFKTTFFELAMMERSRILRTKQYKEERARKEALEREEARAAKFLESVRTRVKWPILPNIDEEDEIHSFASGSVLTAGQLGAADGGADDERSVGSWSAGGGGAAEEEVGSSSGGGNRRGAARHGSKASSSRKSRRPTMAEILGGNSEAASLASTTSSIATKFPKASQETKDFIMEMEAKERDILKMKLVDSSAAADPLHSRAGSTSSLHGNGGNASVANSSIGSNSRNRGSGAKNNRKHRRGEPLPAVTAAAPGVPTSSSSSIHQERSAAAGYISSSSTRKKTNRGATDAVYFDGDNLQPNKIVLHPISISDMGNSDDYDSFLQGGRELQQDEPPPRVVAGDNDELGSSYGAALSSTAEINDYYGAEEFERPNTSHTSRPGSST